MSEIIKVFKQDFPRCRFIGKKYFNKDRVDGNYGAKWGEWFQNGFFEKLERQLSNEFKRMYEDTDAYIGLMRYKEGEEFEYWIGMFLPENAQVEDGFDYVDFPSSNLGVCYVQGMEWEIYGQEERCAEHLVKEGYDIKKDDEGALWFFERYGCPRFTTKNEKGQVILDICHFIK